MPHEGVSVAVGAEILSDYPVLLLNVTAVFDYFILKIEVFALKLRVVELVILL